MTQKSNILITGGSGFIGTQIAHKLHELGHDITIVDRDVKHKNLPGEVIEADYMSYLERTDKRFDTIIHLAADHVVPESLSDPSRYYANNVIKLKRLLDYMVAIGPKNIIFSSTGNLYGRQGLEDGKLTENLYPDPQNPYASSKIAGELMIREYAQAYGIKYVNFRYFNAAGADPQCRFGYVQRPATHVIPVLCNKLINHGIFEVYGSDYNTRDGHCIRDYVHVADIAEAHVLALEFLKGHANDTFNLGGGSDGISVWELAEIAADVTGINLRVGVRPRRLGDPARLVADISKAERILGWKPQYNIRDAILHAWEWEKKYEASN